MTKERLLIDFLVWPKAVTSLGYYPPDANVEIPMKLFERMLEEAPEDSQPAWRDEALASKEASVVMKGGTFYKLLGSVQKVPQYILDWIEEEKQNELQRK
jgi:hypothetical protein